MECACCLSPNDITSIKLPCSHEFHEKCLKQWYIHGGTTCPNCRDSLKLSSCNKYDLYNMDLDQTVSWELLPSWMRSHFEILNVHNTRDLREIGVVTKRDIRWCFIHILQETHQVLLAAE